MLRRSLLKSLLIVPIPLDIFSSISNELGEISFSEFVDFIVDNFNQFSIEELNYLLDRYKEIINAAPNPEELALCSWAKIFNLGIDEKGFCISLAQFIAPKICNYFHSIRPDFLDGKSNNSELKLEINKYEEESHTVMVSM